MDEQYADSQEQGDLTKEEELSSIYSQLGMTKSEFDAVESFLAQMGSAILAKHKHELEVAGTDAEGAEDNNTTADIEKYVSASVIHAFTLMAADDVFSDEINERFKTDPVGATKQLCNELLLFESGDKSGLDQMSLFPEDEPKDDIPSLLCTLSSIAPEKYLIPNNALANTITTIIMNGENKKFLASSIGKKKIYSSCNLVYEGKNLELVGGQLTDYDRIVYNAITTLYVHGDQSHYFTADMVYRAMMGMQDSQSPSPQQIANITESIEKMSRIRAVITCTEEFLQRKIPFKNSECVIKDNLLNTSAIGGTSYADTPIVLYYLNREPVIYTYSRIVHQVLSIPTQRLQIREVNKATGKSSGKRIEHTESRVIIRDHILRHIEQLKNPKNSFNNRNISLYSYKKDGETHTGLFGAIGKPNPTRTEAKRVREYVDTLLAYWVATGYIKNYQWKTQKKKIVSVEIDP